MIKSKEIKTLENSVVELSITIDKNAIKTEYDELLKKYAKTASFKGFRKGKVPHVILERKYGESLQMESGFNLLEKSIEEVLKDVDKKPLPYCTPKLKDEENLKVEADKDLSFTVSYETYPEITVGEYKNLEIEVPEVKISPEDEERELKRYQEQNAVVSEKTEGKSEKDDVVVVNYCELDEKGNEIEGSAREDFTFTIGTGYNLYKFDDDIIGMAKDEEKVIDKSYPDDVEHKDLAGKTVKIKVKVTSIKNRQLPELDDELAQDISEKFKTLDDLKKEINERQNGMTESKLKAMKQQKLIDKIIETSKMDVPLSMVEQEMEHSWHNFLHQFGGEEEQVMRILTMQNKTKEGLFEEWKPSVVNKVKGQLIIGKIIEIEKVEASESEIDEEIKEQALQSGMPEEEFRKYLDDNNMKSYITHSLQEKKAYSMLEESSTIKKGEEIKFIDFIRMGN